jgi:endonuclease/exonuclease/phosphatase family metal-dependent hydrolase
MARSKKRKGRSFGRGILMFMSILLMLATVAAYLAGYVSPEKSWHVAFAGLALPFLVLMNVGMMLLWLLVRPRNALIPLLTLVAGFNISARHLQFNHPDEFEKQSNHIRVASFNAHFWDIWALYGKPQYETLERAEGFFKLEAPGILCLQEGILKHERTGNIADRTRKNLGFGRMVTAPYYPGGSSGLVTYLHGKVTEQGTIGHQGRVIALWCDTEIASIPVRIYNIHLQSIRLGEEEYVMDHLAPDAYRDSLFIKGTRRIAGKLRQAFYVRAAQAERLQQHLDSCQRPVILCGDLNDTPASYAYHRLRKAGLRDAFVFAGKGMGRTYRGKYPSYRIDYIFASKNIVVKTFETRPETLSDHNPIFAWLELSR